MVHLESKDRSDHTGVESYILDKYKQGEQSWLPRQKALCLETLVEGDESETSGNEIVKQNMILWKKHLGEVDACLEELLQMIKKSLEAAKEEEEKLGLKNRGNSWIMKVWKLWHLLRTSVFAPFLYIYLLYS